MSVGQWGNGSLRELFISQTPTELVRELTSKDYHAQDFPRDSQDKSPTTAPLGAVGRATTKTHQYEHFMCSVDFAAAPQKGGNRPRLAAGETHYFRAAFQPEVWEVYIYAGAGAAAGDLLCYATGVEVPTAPYDVLIMALATRSGVETVPGRGHTLTVWTPAANTGLVSVVVKAISSLSGETLGSIVE